MLLYRARSLDSRPRRLPPASDNSPASRIAGRWFTSDLEAAHRHLEAITGKAEIVVIEVRDEIVDSYRVATTPTTRCGLEPGRFSTSPETDYVVPMFLIMDAETVETVAEERNASGRIIDRIDVNAPRSAAVHAAAEKIGAPVIDLPLAA